MNIPMSLLSLLLLAPPVPMVDAPDATDAEAGKATKATCPAVFALAPDDALGIVYLARPGDLFAHRLWSTPELEIAPTTRELFEGFAALFSGPTMIAVCGTPPNPLTMRVEFAVRPQQDVDAFFATLNDKWLPLIGREAGMSAGGVQSTGTLRTFQLPPPMPFVLYAGARDGVIYGSTQRADVAAWQSGEALPGRFAESDRAAKLPTDAFTSADAFVYFDAQPAILITRQEFEREFPGLFTDLGLERLEFIALSAAWSNKAPQVDATVGLAEDGPAGIWDVLAPRNGPLAIPSVVPADYTIFVRGAMASAADNVDALNDVLWAIDPDIVREFQQECGEFKADFGFDPLADFAGNLVDEWIWAARLDPGTGMQWLGAARLADASALQWQMDALSRAFDLNWDVASQHGATVYTALTPGTSQWSWAAVGDYLVFSNAVAPVAEAAAAQASGQSLPATSGLREVARGLPADTAHLAYLNLAPLAQLAAEEAKGKGAPVAMLDVLNRMAQTEAGVGLSVARGEGTVNLRLAGSDAINAETIELSGKMVTLSLMRARAQSKRIVSMSNMRGIVAGCMLYANDHKNAWPPSLAVLIEQDLASPEMFRDPRDTSAVAITADNVDRVGSYLYRPGTDLGPTEVVLCERVLRDGGASFAYADGHVAWIEGAEAAELLARMPTATR